MDSELQKKNDVVRRLEARVLELEGKRCAQCQTKAFRSANITENNLLTFKSTSPLNISRDITDLIRRPLKRQENLDSSHQQAEHETCVEAPSCSMFGRRPMMVVKSANRTKKALLHRLESTSVGESPPKESLLLSPISNSPRKAAPKIRVNDVTYANPIYVPQAFMIEAAETSPEKLASESKQGNSKYFPPLVPVSPKRNQPPPKTKENVLNESKPFFRRVVGNIGKQNRAFKLRLQASPNVKHDHKTGLNRANCISTDDFNEVKRHIDAGQTKDSPFAKLFHNIGRRNKRKSTAYKRKSNTYVTKKR